MGFQFISLQRKAGFRSGNEGYHNGFWIDPSPAHENELDQRYAHSRENRLEPKGNREEPQEYNQAYDYYSGPNQYTFHIRNISG